MARTTIATPGFLDRLGDRVVVADRTGGDLEVLRLRPELTGDPAFEECLKARAEQMAGFQHRAAVRVRGISRLPGTDGRLAVVSDVAKGWRLSEVLQAAEHEGRLIHTSTVLFLLRQVASVAAALQGCGADVAHGALGPERVVLSPAGRVLVVEYVLGSALEHLPPLAADRLWKDLRLAVPATDGGPRFGPHTDVLQLGTVALSLVHNRLLKRDEYPGRLKELLDSATESQVTGARQPLGRVLRDWLEHCLGLAGGQRWTMDEAQRGLEWIVSSEGGYFSTPVGLEPLLQSVERFFTVSPEVVEAATAAPLPPSIAGPVQHERPAEPRTLTLVKAAAEAPTFLPPATEMIARTLAGEPGQDGATADDDARAGSLEALIVTTSPLAQFAGERASEDDAGPLPASPDPVAEARPSVRSAPPLRPSPSSEATLEPGVGPVADMLSIDRPAARRRSGWNGEAWLSRSSDRPASGARSSVPSSGQTMRITRSGGVATATALRAHEAAGVPETGPQQTQPAAKDPSLVPFADAQPTASSAHQAATSGQHAPTSGQHAPASGQHAPASGQHAAASGQHAAGGTTRSLFGVSSDEDHERPWAAEGHRTRRKPKLLWPAAAAFLILCASGFVAWRILSPADGSAAAEAKAVPAEKASLPSRSQTVSPAPVETRRTSEPEAPGAPAPVPEDKPATGSLQLVSPVVVNVSERGESLGTSASPLTLTAGRHVLDLANEELGYRETKAVEVRAGRVARAQLALPNGSVNINATPWAEVLVDGQRVGETPLGNVQLTIGPHEVRFRHPQLGEQVRSVVVTTGAPGRLSVDMKQ